MEQAMTELSLALFTTLLPIGAGAFIALALAFFTTKFSAEQLKKIDTMTLIPLLVVAAGFVASFVHLAAPMNALNSFVGLGHSPLSNEIAVGMVFTVLAIIYWVLAFMGKLSEGARKGLIAVVALAAAVLAIFTGMAYMVDTIVSWNTPLLPVQILGFALLGGALLGTFVLSLSADALKTASATSFKVAVLAMAIAGLLLGAIGFFMQVNAVSGITTPMVAGADLVASVMTFAILAIVGLVIAAIAQFVALRSNGVVFSGIGLIVCFAAVLAARLVFYALQISVGL